MINLTEFGREDNIPLWTSERSGKLCGVRREVNYEVNMMIVIVIVKMIVRMIAVMIAVMFMIVLMMMRAKSEQ